MIQKQNYISIHPMLRFNFNKTLFKLVIEDFNTSYVTVQRKIRIYNLGGNRKFQYILCYGSTVFVDNKISKII